MADADPQVPSGRAPQRPPGGGGRTRPPRPRPRRRGKYYWASLVLAGVFVAAALAFPIWLDAVRRGADPGPAEAPSQEAAPAASTPGLAPATPAAATPGQVNTLCRGYVYARCNALFIEPQPCLRIAVTAMSVPIDRGMEGCREAVDARIREAAMAAGRTESQIAGTANPAEEGQAEAGAPDSGPSGPPDVPGDARAADAGPGKAGGGAQAAAGGPDGKPASTPQDRVRQLEQITTLLDELQRGGNNYATSPAIQAERLQKLRALVEADGSPETRELFNRLVDRYQHRDPPAGGGVTGESPAVEVRRDGDSPAETPEGARVRAMLDAARNRANLPPAPAPSSQPREAAPAPAYESPSQAAPGEVPSGQGTAVREYNP